MVEKVRRRGDGGRRLGRAGFAGGCKTAMPVAVWRGVDGDAGVVTVWRGVDGDAGFVTVWRATRLDGDGGSVAVGGGALPTMPVGGGQGAAATGARR